PKGASVAGGHKTPAGSGLEQIFGAGDTVCDDRHSGGKRLKDGKGQAFHIRRERTYRDVREYRRQHRAFEARNYFYVALRSIAEELQKLRLRYACPYQQ